ncbi:Elicitor-responsive protein 1 [Carex littledalei]|uniref:Elicitor-responsive protein 1 n=1 Tax=Carex littledalei TaxID=544730 RepID=A0A833VSH5_9POAL|nr:Elicitor-responsive protein 1 [Carex littledalei]
MRGGALEVLLVRAEGLKHAHFSEIDERVWWNEKFRFVLPQLEFKEMPKLTVRLMKRVKFLKDCSIGETTVYLGEILAEGCEKGFIEIKPAAYNIVLEDGTYEGEMKLGIRYIPNVELKEQTYNSTRNIHQEKKQSICRVMLSIALKRIPWSKIFFFRKYNAHEESRKNE